MFDYPYALPKLDILAIPNFAFQAMENWGLLYFTQTRIETDPAESPLSEKCAASAQLLKPPGTAASLAAGKSICAAQPLPPREVFLYESCCCMVLSWLVVVPSHASLWCTLQRRIQFML